MLSKNVNNQNLLSIINLNFSEGVGGTLGMRCASHRREGRLGRIAVSKSLIEKCEMENA